MPVQDMNFLKEAPTGAHVAMDKDQSRILFWEPTFKELMARIDAEGLRGKVVIWKNPPSWNSWTL